MFSSPAYGRFKIDIAQRGRVAPFVPDGPINREALETYIERVLVRFLPPRDVVIMENLSSHKGRRARDPIEAAGATLLYLPPCSPDINPIENAFAKLEALLRKAAKRTVDGLWAAIGRLIDTFRHVNVQTTLRPQNMMQRDRNPL